MEHKRKFIHIQGEQNWGICIVQQLLAELDEQFENTICYGVQNGFLNNSNIKHINKSKKRSEIENHLGSENSILIFNCYDGFNPDLFCALAGLIKSPGLILFLTPKCADWPTFADPDYSRFISHPHTLTNIKGRFLSYFIRRLSLIRDKCFLNIEQNISTDKDISSIKTITYNIFQESDETNGSTLQISGEQKQVVNAIQAMIETQQKETLVIYASRGRGKTTAIGLALSLLLQKKHLKICIISQNKSNVIPIIECLNNERQVDKTEISFLAPDKYLNKRINWDLVVIDEAAAIPLPMVKKLVLSCSKSIVSTTIEGYEGSGMGFRTKFQRFLDMSHRLTTVFELKTPYRWKSNDPIEQFIFTTFVPLKSALSAGEEKIPDTKTMVVNRLSRDHLIHDAEKTQQLFCLLAQAHYRTTPDDLRYLLDAPDLEIWVAECQGRIYAAMLVASEGLLENTFLQSIWLGERRLNGHLIPQTLSSQSGFAQAIKFSYKRIVRIVTAEHHRNLGIASKLLAQFHSELLSRNPSPDFIGVSFGHEALLHKFWLKHDFVTVRLGHQENARSGLRSMLMLKPLTDSAVEFCSAVEKQFGRNQNFNVTVTLENPALAIKDRQPIGDWNQDRLDIYSFAFGHRQFSNCHRALSLIANYCLNIDQIRTQLTPQQIKIVTLRVLQNQNWNNVASLTDISGKTRIVSELRNVYAIFYMAVWGNKS